jgi:outer membrane lipoprotein SlyB
MNRLLLTLTLFISTLVQAQEIKLNGIISAEYNQIKNLAYPTSTTDAATKIYVDNNIFSGNYNDLINKPTVFNGNFVGTLLGDVFGNLTGDVFGNLTGNVTGNVTGGLTGDVTGNLTGNVTGGLTGDVTGNLTGNVTGDLTGDVTGNLTGNVIGDLTGEVTGDVTGNLTGNVIGDVTGNVIGDVTGNVTGGLTGDVTGNVTGDLTGNVTGSLTGDVTGNVTGDLTGNVTGSLTGDVTGNVTGDLTGDVTGNVTGDVTSNSVITQMLKLVTLTDSERNSITPEEGMLIYNETARQLQIYSTVSSTISNTTFAGEFTDGDDTMNQSFVPHIAGDIISISVYGKKTQSWGDEILITFEGQVDMKDFTYWDSQSINSPTWHEFTFDTPVTVNAGQNYTFRLWGPGTCGGNVVFSTNYSYSQGSVSANNCGGTPVGFANGKDLAFLVTFANNTTQLGWLSIN